jgi:hypothetical protein
MAWRCDTGDADRGGSAYYLGMPNQFEIQVPTTDGQTLSFGLSLGDTLYLLGANGTGKSSLVSRFANEHQSHVRRISAHRQTWFESNTLDMTPRSRQDLENNVRSQDAQPQARWREWNAVAPCRSLDVLVAAAKERRVRSARHRKSW